MNWCRKMGILELRGQDFWATYMLQELDKGTTSGLKVLNCSEKNTLSLNNRVVLSMVSLTIL